MQPKIRNLCLSLENRILNLHPFNPEQACCCIATWFIENKILFRMKEYDGCGLDELLKLNFKDYPTENYRFTATEKRRISLLQRSSNRTNTA